MQCIAAAVDGTDLVLYTAESTPWAAGLPQPREVVDLGSIIAWSIGKHRTDYSDNHKPGQVYQSVMIQMISGRIHEYAVRVGQWIKNNEEIEYDTGLIDELIHMLQRRFA